VDDSSAPGTFSFHGTRRLLLLGFGFGVARAESETYPPKRGAPLRRRRPVRTPVPASPIRHATNGMLPRERGMALCLTCSPVKIIMPATVRPRRFAQSDDSLPPRNRALCLSCPSALNLFVFRTNVVSLIYLPPLSAPYFISSPSSPQTYSCYDRKIRAFVFHKSYSTRKTEG